MASRAGQQDLRGRLPSHEGSGLKYLGDSMLFHLQRLPSHEGSGLKSPSAALAAASNVSPLARGEQTEIGIVILSMRRSTSATSSSPANRRS